MSPGYPPNRCPDCGMGLEGCLCADLPRLVGRVRLLFVQHPFEVRKPTGSARLACRILSNARRETWDRTLLPTLEPGSLLLYPFPDAPILEAKDLGGSPVLAIPDGTWPQAARIANALLRRTAVLPRALPPDLHPLWSLRDGGSPDRISSAQAASEALRIAGDHDASRTLEQALAQASRGIRAMRGLSGGE